MKRISIITPAYNCISTIKATYESILIQNYDNYEWIVIDDCSNDGTYDFLLELSKTNSNIIVLKTSENSGAAIARNLGINKASGDYIAFLDSDDLWKSGKLEKQIQYMESNGYEFSYTNYDVLRKDGKIKAFSPSSDFADYKILLKKCDIGCLTAIYDVQKLGKILMPVDCPKREDYAMWLDITKKGIIAHKLNESLAIYRLTDGSVSSKKMKLLRNHYCVYRKHEKMNLFKSHFYLFIQIFNKLFKKY